MNSIQLNNLQSHREYLRHYAIARTQAPSEAEDLVQESLARALTYARGDKTIRNLRAYLFAILKNVLVDTWSRKRRSIAVVPLANNLDNIAEAPAQIAHIEWIELIEAIAKLPEAQRQVVMLVGLEGMPYQSAAEIMDIPIGTVMSRLNRGRESLRRAFIDDEMIPTAGGTRHAPNAYDAPRCPARAKRQPTQDKFIGNKEDTTGSLD